MRPCRSWVNLDQTGSPGHVRFSPNSDRAADIAVGPVRAMKRLMRGRNLTGLFDHLVGAREQCSWQFEAKRLCGLEVDHQFVLGRRLHG
jgi:hypothetical protein